MLVLATSMAVLPPPTTITFSPIFTGLFSATFIKKSIPPNTPGVFSPSHLIGELFHAPMPRNTASYLFCKYSKEMSSPTFTP